MSCIHSLTLEGLPKQLGELELAEDSVDVVALRRGPVEVDPSEPVDRERRQRTQRVLVILAKRLQQRRQQIRRNSRLGSLRLSGQPVSIRGRPVQAGGQLQGEVLLRPRSQGRKEEIEQCVERAKILHPLDEGRRERGAELWPVAEIDVADGLHRIESFNHRHGNGGLAQSMDELKEGGGGGKPGTPVGCPAHCLIAMLATPTGRANVRIANRLTQP